MTPEMRNKLKNRLHRVEGQLRGIENMAYQDRELGEIVQQLWAVRASVTMAALFLAEEAEVPNELLRRLLKSL